jgi:hypothetical protein
MKPSCAPIALFVYNRPWHARQTVEALLKNELAAESDLIVFSDGPKRAEEASLIAKVREYVHSISGFRSVRVVEREQNLGLAPSVIAGVSEVVNEYGKLIVMEDDLVTSPFFLRFINDALEYYENEDKVICINGYCYPMSGLPETYFVKGADNLGWATWKRGWDLFEADGRKLLEQLEQKRLLSRFDFFGASGHSQMLKDQIEGKNSSWAIRWCASALLKDKLTLYPGQSLVFHIGSDGSGTHCRTADDSLDVVLCNKTVKVGTIDVSENKLAVEKFRLFFKEIYHPSLLRRIRNRLYRLIMRMKNSVLPG